MNEYRYIYVVISVDTMISRSKSKWLKCAFKTRDQAKRWIARFHAKEASLIGSNPPTNLRIKQVLLYNRNDL